MGKTDGVIEVDGIVEESMPNAMFRVRITDQKVSANDVMVLATISGKMRVNHIRIIPGDRVKVAVSVYDTGKGRITFRYKDQNFSPPQQSQAA